MKECFAKECMGTGSCCKRLGSKDFIFPFDSDLINENDESWRQMDRQFRMAYCTVLLPYTTTSSEHIFPPALVTFTHNSFWLHEHMRHFLEYTRPKRQYTLMAWLLSPLKATQLAKQTVGADTSKVHHSGVATSPQLGQTTHQQYWKGKDLCPWSGTNTILKNDVTAYFSSHHAHWVLTAHENYWRKLLAVGIARAPLAGGKVCCYNSLFTSLFRIVQVDFVTFEVVYNTL